MEYILKQEGEEFARMIKDTNDRIDKLKKILTDYLTLANEFAVASIRTSLKSV